MRFPSPLRYPGGKSRIFPFVSKLFYENDLIGCSYAEPYAGGCGLALKLLFGEFVDRIYINDLDRAIYAFWKYVLTNPDDLCRWIMNVTVDIPTWRRFKHIYQNSNDFSDRDLARATFFLNRTNVSGVITGGMIGGLAQESKYNITARFYRSQSVEKIEKIAGMADRIHLSNMDGIAFVRQLERRKENIFIYLDPPYVHKASELYMNHYAEDDHRKLSRFVNQMKKKWMISYDQNDFILQLYDERRRLFHSLSRGTSNIIGDEVIVFSDNIEFQQSSSFLKSPIATNNESASKATSAMM